MSRGGKNKSGRPFLNNNEGLRKRHNITINDKIWNEMMKESEELNLSVSQFIEKIFRFYQNNK